MLDDNGREDTTFDAQGKKDLVTDVDSTGGITKTQDFAPDGSHVDEVRGADGVFDRFSYDGLDRLLSTSDWATDGSAVVTTNDVANTHPWASLVDQYDAAGRLVSETYNDDDGARQLYQLDPTNANSWSSIEYDYDPAGRTRTIEQLQDDGSRYDYQFDAAGTQSWSSLENVIDANGHVTTQVGTYDNGHTWSTAYDPYDQSPWSSDSTCARHQSFNRARSDRRRSPPSRASLGGAVPPRFRSLRQPSSSSPCHSSVTGL